jgi:hypothetical protein
MPATVSPPSIRANASFLPVATNLVAAFLAGSLFLPLAVQVSGYRYFLPSSTEISLASADVARAMVLLIALAVSDRGPPASWTWRSAPAMRSISYRNGLPLDAASSRSRRSRSGCTGGVLAAFATSDTASRWACAVGLGVGVVAGWPMYRNILLDKRPDVLTHAGLLLGAIAGLVLVAGVALLVTGVRAALPSTGGANWWGPVVAVVAAAVGGRVLGRVWQTVLADMVGTTEGGTDPRNAMIETLDQVVGIGIAVVIAVILLVAAYPRGGASLARWVVVGFALAASGMALPQDFDGSVIVDVVPPAAAGAVAAAAMVRRADRWVPADAVGVALAAVAVLLSSPGSMERPASQGAMIALAFTYAFTLTAGLARLVDGRGRGIIGAEVAGAAALGFAVLLLAEPVFTPPGFLQASVYQPVQVSRVLTLAGARSALAVRVRHRFGECSARSPARQPAVGPPLCPPRRDLRLRRKDRMSTKRGSGKHMFASARVSGPISATSANARAMRGGSGSETPPSRRAPPAPGLGLALYRLHLARLGGVRGKGSSQRTVLARR